MTLNELVKLTTLWTTGPRWLSHENALQTVRKLYIPICKDLENAVVEGRDKRIREGNGMPTGSLLKMMKTYDSIFFTHLLCDVCTSLSSLTRLFERNDVDLSIIEPKIQATITGLQKMKMKDGPYLAKAQVVADELGISGQPKDVTEARNKFLDELYEEMENRLQNYDVISNLSALNLSQVPPDGATFHGDHQVSQLAEMFNLDVDETLSQWNEMKEMFRDELSDCTPAKLLRTMTDKKSTLGEMYPNVVNLLKVHESLIISTAPIERVFSRVKLIVSDHRNRLKVETTNKLLMVALNTEEEADMDFNKVVSSFLKKKCRRIC